MNTTPTATKPEHEQEELNASNVNAPTTPAKKQKTDKALNPLLDYLQANGPSMLAVAMRHAFPNADDGATVALMNLVKGDDRFITYNDGIGLMVSLEGEHEKPATVPAAEPAVKSIGELLAETNAAGEAVTDAPKAAPKADPVVLIADAQIGDRVEHVNHGPGTVVNRNDITLWVKFDRLEGDPTMLGIQFLQGALAYAPKPNAAQSAPQAIPEVAQTISEEERQANYQKALVAHALAGSEIAKQVADLEGLQESQKAEVAETKKQIDQLMEKLMKHSAVVPTMELACQRTIGFDVAKEGGDLPGVMLVTPEGFHPLPADQVLSLKDSGLTMEILHRQVVEEFTPGKKSKKVGDLAVEVRGAAYLIRQGSPDKTRWFLQPLIDQESWEQVHQATFGKAVADFDENSENKADRAKGGADCGRLLKIGKKHVVLGPESMGLVLVASQEAIDAYVGRTTPTETSGKDAAAGE